MKYLIILFALVLVTGCYDQEIQPVTEEDFPLQVVLDVNEGGTYESNDEYKLKISFDSGVDEVVDENGNVIAGSPAGTRGPYASDVTVNFMIEDLEGLNVGDELDIDEVIYEIDDCTEGSAPFTFNPDGSGSFTIPAGVEEVEIVFALDDEALNNDIVNSDDMGFALNLTNIEGNTEDVVININNVFEYQVLDDEGINNEWILDHEDTDLLSDFIMAFIPVNEDLEGLTSADIDEIKFEFEFDELKIVVALAETEMVEECGESEEKNIEIELEAEFEVEDGEIEMVFENSDGDEFTYAGSYEVIEGTPFELSMTVSGEDEDGETVADEVTLTLTDDD